MRFLFLLVLLVAAPAQAAVVECHDAARGVVQPVEARECRGRIVDALEAEALRAAFEAERRTAIRRGRKPAAYALASAGTGFAVSANGVILTTAHGVAGCDALRARGGDGALRRARALHVDARADLALLEIDPPALGVARLAPSAPGDGAALRLVGYPLEGMVRLRASETPVTVDHGIASPGLDGMTGLRGDVRRGHSGGPVLDGSGAVAGLLRQKVDSVAAFRRDGRLLRHMGVYAPAAALRAFLHENGVAASAGRGGWRDFTLRIDCLRKRPRALGD